MQLDSESIFNAALNLSEAERLALVSRLMETMPADTTGASLDDPQLVDEIERRFADDGHDVPWADLRSEG